MRTKYKPWAKPYLDEHQEVQLDIESISSLDDIYLEIGSGKGQFLVDIAFKNPHRNYIGIERNVTCAGFTIKKLVEQEISNAKLIFDNAERVLPLFADKSVKVIYLNFSDPWPKVRHHKRRLTASTFLTHYHRILNKDGLIIQKTDNKDLYLYSLETYEALGYKIISQEENYMLDESDVLTEYEKDFRNEGLPIYRIVVKNYED